MHPLLAALSEPQRQAASHVEGPLLVLAGPGSGKTRVITHRIAYLLERGIEARSILAVTFTNKAAREMRDRVRKLVRGRGRASALTVATFHSACARILREEIEAFGYRRDFTIYDESSQESLVRQILRDVKTGGTLPSPAALLAEIGAASPPPGQPGDPSDPRAALVVHARDRYREEMRARNAVDFDDLIRLTARLFRERSDVLARWHDRFRHLLVDEYQDTNGAQDEILQLLAGERANLCVVGDDDQSIYSFRGAVVDHILEFPRRYPRVKVVRLERNYRSTLAIVAVAGGVIARNERRHGKRLHTERGRGAPVRLVVARDDEEEALWLAREIADRVLAEGAKPYEEASRHAVLVRTNEQMRPIEQALRRLKVPYRLLGGRSFFDRKEVLDVLSYLRLAANRADEESLWRAIQTPSRGVGARAVEMVRADAARRAVPVWEVLAGDLEVPGLLAPARAGIARFVAVVAELAAAAERRSPTLVTDLLAAIDYRTEVEKTYKDPQVQASRWSLAQELQKTWTAYRSDAGAEGIGAFLDSLALGWKDDDDDQGSGVTLATAHASKGLEFAMVYVAGVEEGTFPHRRSLEDGPGLEEERRLFYVALTRAMDRLTLTRAATRVVRGKETRVMPSRFLEDLEGGLIESVDAQAPRPSPGVAAHLDRLRAALGR